MGTRTQEHDMVERMNEDLNKPSREMTPEEMASFKLKQEIRELKCDMLFKVQEAEQNMAAVRKKINNCETLTELKELNRYLK